MTTTAPIIPEPSPTSKPFWDALREGRVVIQRCAACGTWVHYPRSHCPHCLATDLTWTEIAGTGTLYTYTIARQATTRAFEGLEPQLLAVVALDEGPRVTTTLVNVDPDEIEVGMAVRPVFERADDEITLLRYEPAG